MFNLATRQDRNDKPSCDWLDKYNEQNHFISFIIINTFWAIIIIRTIRIHIGYESIDQPTDRLKLSNHHQSSHHSYLLYDDVVDLPIILIIPDIVLVLYVHHHFLIMSTLPKDQDCKLNHFLFIRMNRKKNILTAKTKKLLLLMMAMMEKVFDDDDDLYLCDDGVKTRSTRVKQSSSINEKKRIWFFFLPTK